MRNTKTSFNQKSETWANQALWESRGKVGGEEKDRNDRKWNINQTCLLLDYWVPLQPHQHWLIRLALVVLRPQHRQLVVVLPHPYHLPSTNSLGWSIPKTFFLFFTFVASPNQTVSLSLLAFRSSLTCKSKFQASDEERFVRFDVRTISVL